MNVIVNTFFLVGHMVITGMHSRLKQIKNTEIKRSKRFKLRLSERRTRQNMLSAGYGLLRFQRFT